MATVKKVPIEQYKIVLELSEEEAEIIKHIVGNVSGSGKIRDITSNIYSQLHGIDVKSIRPLFTECFKLKEWN